MAENTTFAVMQTKGTGDFRTSWGQLELHCYIKMAIIGVLFYLLFRNEFSGIVHRWYTDTSWTHGFLIPLFSLYFINQYKIKILNLRTRPAYILGMAVIIFGISFYIFNMASPSGYGYFRYISVIITLGGVVLLIGGWPLVKYTWLPVAFLVFAVPLPSRYYFSLTLPMRRWAASIASALLNVVPDLDAQASGVIIDVIYKGTKLEPALNVAEACSGMRLLMAFLALGVAMAYLHHRDIWQRIVLLASTIPIAIFCNIIRVTATGFIYVLIDPAYTQGIYHDILGLAMIPLAFGLYGALAWFMSSLFIEQDRQITEDVIVRSSKSEMKTTKTRPD